MSEWIPVEDDLPELETLVLVCLPNYAGAPRYAWGARIDDGEGWLWGLSSSGTIDPERDIRWNDVEADDDYQVQFWKPIDKPPPVRKVE
jgi:Protein of unknown function (DUF551)